MQNALFLILERFPDGPRRNLIIHISLATIISGIHQGDTRAHSGHNLPLPLSVRLIEPADCEMIISGVLCSGQTSVGAGEG